jgi:CelD/BcsL family acetyltransferase involved in cellulose biosynthesis
MRQTSRGLDPNGVEVTVYPAHAWKQVEQGWTELARASPYASFFLGVEWTASWVEVFGPALDPEILLFHADGKVVGACLLVSRVEFRGPFPVRRIYLNTSGEDDADSPFIEYNNLLCLAGWEAPIAEAIYRHVRPRPWDEFVAKGFCEGPSLEALKNAFAGCSPLIGLCPSYYVDLARIREEGASYESVLGGNTRRNLRKAFRKYGDPRVEEATTLPGALGMLDELAELHQRSWTARNQPGMFASELFFAFHRSLISRAFPHGGVQLVRVTAGGETVGILYNFVADGRVYFYQSGLRYDAERRRSPGVVTIACAVTCCLEKGLNECDFLAGEREYKRWLSTGSHRLVWALFRRPSWKLRTIEILRRLKRLGARAAPGEARH